jgi:hypothetical protein
VGRAAVDGVASGIVCAEGRVAFMLSSTGKDAAR